MTAQPCAEMEGRTLPMRFEFVHDNRDVKSTSPLQKNGYENCIYSTNNIYMSNEDNKHDTNYINKNDTNNHDARKLHELARHIERAVSSSHLDGTCTSMAQDVLGSQLTPSSYMCGSP